jgi:hypothetical protein
MGFRQKVRGNKSAKTVKSKKTVNQLKGYLKNMEGKKLRGCVKINLYQRSFSASDLC